MVRVDKYRCPLRTAESIGGASVPLAVRRAATFAERKATIISKEVLTRRRPRRARRATLFIGVLACLTLGALLMGTLLRNMVAARRAGDRYEYGLQSQLLADAGLRRAVAQLSRVPAYTGETWEIPAEVFGRPYTAVVVIRVNRLETDAQFLRILIESQYPAGSTRRIVRTRDFLVPDPDDGEA